MLLPPQWRPHSSPVSALPTPAPCLPCTALVWPTTTSTHGQSSPSIRAHFHPHIPGTKQRGSLGQGTTVPTTLALCFASCKAKGQGGCEHSHGLDSLLSIHSFSSKGWKSPDASGFQGKGTTRLLHEVGRHLPPCWNTCWEGHQHCGECKQRCAQQPWPNHKLSQSSPSLSLWSSHTKKNLDFLNSA